MECNKISLGAYIFSRIRSLGVQHIFGVPGDYNLNLLDHLYTVQGLNWVGTCNELNAAYAADGYARSRGLPGVLVTTYGVGELSAINGIGGAHSEWIPIIHIVGSTPRFAQERKMMIHHTCGGEGWDHKTVEDMSAPLSCASVSLDNDETFTEDIDRVLEECLERRLPVYIRVPADTPDILVDSTRLQTPLQGNRRRFQSETEDRDDEVVRQIVQEINSAKKPCVLVDALTQRFGLTDTVQEILRLAALPGFVTPLAKSVLDETSDQFRGVYMGIATPSAEVKRVFEEADLSIHIGRFPSDTNCGGFTQKFAPTVIGLHPDYVFIGDTRWEKMSFVSILQKLARDLASSTGTPRAVWCPPIPRAIPKLPQNMGGGLEQAHIWNVFNRYLGQGDCVIAEVGCSQFGTLGIALPPLSEYYTQIFYSCIGFTVGATLGTLVARKELAKPGRVILFVGDGSLQMTVQEVGTMLRYGFKPIIVVINNEGYTVERVIHGPAKVHNDIGKWDYQSMLRFFGGEGISQSYSARTYAELVSILENPSFQACSQMQVLECHLHKYDAPANLSDLVDIVTPRAIEMQWQMDKQANRSRLVLDGTLAQSGLSFRAGSRHGLPKV